MGEGACTRMFLMLPNDRSRDMLAVSDEPIRPGSMASDILTRTDLARMLERPLPLSPHPGRPETQHIEDLALARAILAGSEAAWHSFIRRYGQLIQSVIRRYLGRSDDARSLFVDVLETLFHGKLRE